MLTDFLGQSSVLNGKAHPGWTSLNLGIFMDIVSSCLSMWIGCRFSPHLHCDFQGIDADSTILLPVYSITFLLVSQVFRLYERNRQYYFYSYIYPVGFMVLFSFLCTLFLLQRMVGPWTTVLTIISGTICSSFTRSLERKWFPHSPLRVVVIGQTVASILLVEEASRRGLSIEVIPHSAKRKELVFAGDMDPCFNDGLADMIVVDEPCSEMMITDAPKYLLLGIPVITYQNFFEKLFGKVAPETITNRWALDLRLDLRDRLYFKRALDLLLAFSFLILLFPIFPLIAIAIWLCDKGPIFYVQARVGKGGEIFNIYKFRTMRTDAERFGPRWASGLSDPRVIKCGNFLRRTRLDEIPQLLNIIKGEMSFVGPRPERPEFVEYLKRRLRCYELRHIVKPGLTGYAQINYHYGSSERDALEKLRYDLYYIKNRNVLVDLYIIIFTVTAIIRGIILGR